MSPTEDPEDNKAYCRAYRERVRSDPKKREARRAYQREYMRGYRARKSASLADGKLADGVVGVSKDSEPVLTGMDSVGVGPYGEFKGNPGETQILSSGDVEEVRELTFVPEGVETDITLEDLFG